MKKYRQYLNYGIVLLIVIAISLTVTKNAVEKSETTETKDTVSKYDALIITQSTFENITSLKISDMPPFEGIPIWRENDSTYGIESVFYVRNQYSKMDKYFYSASIKTDKQGKGICTFEFISKDTTLIYPKQ